jgi:hypothetical protein
MRKVLISVVALAALSACAQMPFGKKTDTAMVDGVSAPAAAQSAAIPSGAAKTAAALDTTTEAQRSAAAVKPAAAAEKKLGTTIASLGDPTDPGFWIKTSLVSVNATGRVEDPATGKSVQVELIPSGAGAGAGSQMSLPAMRLLGVSLTDLPEVAVYQS